ncbi:MAG: hypothetical protein JJT77_13815 [Crocinitomicaceae bacterium]|nr:hypothetical protein [Crocinitomicaceae bacterium]
MFESVNLVDALNKEKIHKEKFLQKILSVLEFSNETVRSEDANLFYKDNISYFYLSRTNEEIKDSILLPSAWGKNENSALSDFRASDVYSLEQIQSVSANYRLRFLPSHMFKGEIPSEAIAKVRQIEDANRTILNEFFIMAPGALFNLEDAQKDPLLFAKIGENQFLLIHRWGKDLHWTRKLVCYPLRSIYTFFISVLMLSTIIALLIPIEWIDFAMRSWTLRVWLVVHTFMALSGFFIFMGSVYQRNFSIAEWNSKYFNG